MGCGGGSAGCICYSSVTVINHHDWKQLTEEFIVAYGSREAWQQTAEVGSLEVTSQGHIGSREGILDIE